MMRLMITAPASNSGKTAVTCGLLATLQKRGIRTVSFKCGPDYIDPMFHRSVLGVESHNLDIFLAGEDGAAEIYRKYSLGADAIITEGVMGYYDGIGGGEAKASPWHISTILDMPAVLVVRPGGSALSLGAVIKGMARFRDPSNIAAVILNDCSRSFFENYGRLLEEESGVPVIGYLPHMEEAIFGSRHLGLMTAGEIDDLKERIDRIGLMLEESLDMERLISLTSADLPEENHKRHGGHICDKDMPASKSVRIGVARDEAFCFIYQETLDRIRDAGGEPVFFSPLKDNELPSDLGGLYIPGGYPELHGRKIQDNRSMADSVREAIKKGLPTVAECGGFLYLGRSLKDKDGKIWDMVGALPGDSENRGRLVRFGYGHIRSDEDSLLFRKGESVPVHEFHYWDTTDQGTDLEFIKASNGNKWEFGYSGPSIYAGFPHLYMGGEIPLAERFLEAARSYTEKQQG